MPHRNGRSGVARSVALGGILSSFAIVILMGGGYIPIGTFAAPIFAGLCLMPIAIDIGVKWALLCYLAVCLLSFLLVPDMELVLFFVVLLGWYPIFQPVLGRLRSRALRFIIKLVMFNAAVAVVYCILLFLFISPELQQEFSEHGWWYSACLLAVGNLTFFLYDNMLYKVRLVYHHRIRRYLFR
ncbi:hypothetical protein LJC64_03765 [Ruminococcaceae bacterium OttesenSCG-928-A11]|nr:hypothetical protein [Ruminococcaceae bacterium OttesenSCG-928-A11]